MLGAGITEAALVDIRRVVDEAAGRSVKLLDLLEAVGTRRRGTRAVEIIEAVLEERGVDAWPPITVAPLDGEVALRPRGGHAPAADIEGERDQDAQAGDIVDGISVDLAIPPLDSIRLGLYVGNVLSSSHNVESVMVQDSPRSVVTRLVMRPDEPVMVFRDKNRRMLEGIVTWESIVRYQLSHGFQEPPTLASIVTPVELVRQDEDLLPLVARILERQYVAVLDRSRTVIALLGVADLARHFIEKTRPYLLVADIEQVLRAIIAARLMDGWTEIVGLESDAYGDNRAPASPDELSFGTYVRVLQSPRFFDQLGWRLDRKLFARELDAVREIRNEIMHFSPDPAPDAVPQLRGFLELLRVVEPDLVSSVAPGALSR
jgi:hypothetical protein